MALSNIMQQYLSLKDQNKDAILFFRLGDFYEMFFDDAVLVSGLLELTLTGRDCGLSERAPMCGVPYHAAEVYIARLIEKGYKVAIAEQMSDPKASKGLVERSIVRVVTPGTVIDTSMLSERQPNYILALCINKDKAGLAFADVSTGEFNAYQIDSARLRLSDEIARIAPKEILSSDSDVLGEYSKRINAVITVRDELSFEYTSAKHALAAHFGASATAELDRLSVCAAGALIAYLTETQKNALPHIHEIVPYDKAKYLSIDVSACANLEILQSLRTKSRKGSLLNSLDQTVTAMGGRELRAWLAQPLKRRDEIDERLDAVEQLASNPMLMDSARDALSGMYDIERLLGKIAYETVNPQDMLALAATLRKIPELKELLKDSGSALESIGACLNEMEDIASEIERTIDPDAPTTVKEGGIIKAGCDSELDEIRFSTQNEKSMVAMVEARERERSGNNLLKVGYNRIAGYYIEITKARIKDVPADYIRKQTLTNCERFTTPELERQARLINENEDKTSRLEYEIFERLRDKLKDNMHTLRDNAAAIKKLDALQSLAKVAMLNDYCRPKFNDEGIYEIKDGRHPVVEDSIGRQNFVPNDTHLNENGTVMIITGPNMAGKSTYMRQVALITLMAHVGSFVPASEANISLTDRIFTRIGASDDLYAGQSTFMVEMSEMATILKFATKRSLVILDEVGRGTSTFDGLSIAWAAVEYIASEKCGARCMFATHYHELSVLEGQLKGVVNYRVTAKEQGEDVIFLRKVVPGGEDRSYGVAVAKLAGLPNGVISRARQIMARLEVDETTRGSIGASILDKRKNSGDRQLALTEIAPMQLVEEIRALDVMGMSPIEALNKLFSLCEKARRI